MAVVQRSSADSAVTLTGQATPDLVSAELHHAWMRWCIASISKHFDDAKGNFALYLEGDERTTQDEHVFAELRQLLRPDATAGR